MTDDLSLKEHSWTLNHKLRVESRVRAAAGFPQVRGGHYLPYLEEAHRRLKPECYLEVGTESGASLGFARCRSFSVDPNFKLEADVVRNKPEVHFYQGTSDDFFASRMVEKLDARIDLAFLDGMHLFEFLLRDFINTERVSKPSATVYLHDCVPFNGIMAERVWDRERTGAWTGDIWKVVPILRKYRPDLDIRVLDLAPTGLVQITNLDPDSSVLSDAYDEIVADYMPETIDSFGLDRLKKILSLEHTNAEPIAPAVKRTRRVAILIPPNSFPKAPLWGEYWFGRGIERAFQRQGYEAEMLPRKRWGEDRGQAFELVLRTPHAALLPRSGMKSVAWIIYGDDTLTEAEEESYRHVFSASPLVSNNLIDRLGSERVSVLYQAFDKEVMSADGPVAECGRLYVANQHDELRRTARLLLETGLEADIWGRKWQHSALAHLHRGQSIENTELPAYYRGATLVLNDHAVGMADAGFTSNRVFDVLACGAPLVSDYHAGIPSDIAAFIHSYIDDRDFEAAVLAAEGESQMRLRERRDFARQMQETHSFDQRVARIMEVL